MNRTKIALVSLVSMATLFTACGGGGGTPQKTNTPPPTNQPKLGGIKTKTTYDVLANKTTYVTVLTGEDFINTDTGESFYTYSVSDKGTAAFAKFDVKNYGILKYTNSGANDTVKISVTDTRTGKTVTQDLQFNVVADNDATPMKVLKTGQEDGDAGEDRAFTRGPNPTDDVVDGVNNIKWDDDISDFGHFKSGDQTFQTAKSTCEGVGGRLPTEEELFTTVYYKSDRYQSPTVDKNMLDDAFKARESYFWASSGRAINYANGTFTTGDKARFRCIKEGGIVVDKHLKYTTDDEVTHDLSTGLEWTKATTNRMKYDEAKAYCEGLTTGGHSGWSLPTINQLRSIIDNNLVDGAVIGSSMTLLSSTKVIAKGADGSPADYHLYVVPSDGRLKYRIETAALKDSHSITCVRKAQ